MSTYILLPNTPTHSDKAQTSVACAGANQRSTEADPGRYKPVSMCIFINQIHFIICIVLHYDIHINL